MSTPPAVAPAQPASTTSHGRRRFRIRGIGVVGILGIAALLTVAVLAPVIAPYEPGAQNISNTLAPPIWAGGESSHLLGTDALGRDVFSRLVYGARSSVLIAVCAMLIGMSLGVVTGLAAGFLGRWVDTVLMRFGDVQLALPFILIAIVILGMMSDRDPIHLIVVLGVPAWIVYARVVRSRVLSERERDYVRAAETLGASRWRQMSRYVLPQVWGVVPPIVLVDLSNLVIMESTLSFLGFGLTPPSVSWGQVLADGRQNMVSSPWLPILPGIAIMLSVLALNLAVEGLRPKTLRPHKRSRVDRPSGDVPVQPSRVDGVATALLEVRDLEVDFPVADGGTVRAVSGVSFGLDRGSILGIVGESGSGKSVTAWAVLGLLTPPGRVTGGKIHFDGMELTTAPEKALREIRGRRIGMMFQNPVGSLNPVLTVGHQIIETIRTHLDVSAAEARRLARQALEEVGFGDPEYILEQYPFRLSGGQNQRVVIAMTTILEPQLLLADEPTTALDVTTQAQVLDQLRRLRDKHGTSIVLISHDIGLIAETADVVVVMYAGEVSEIAPTEQIISSPRHPYTKALLESVPGAQAAASGDLRSIPGELPDPTRPAIGCPFADRCPEVMDRCRTDTPARHHIAAGWISACHLHDDVPQETLQ